MASNDSRRRRLPRHAKKKARPVDAEDCDSDYHTRARAPDRRRMEDDVVPELAVVEPEEEKAAVDPANLEIAEDGEDNGDLTVYAEPIPLDGVPAELAKLMTEVCPLL